MLLHYDSRVRLPPLLIVLPPLPRYIPRVGLHSADTMVHPSLPKSGVDPPVAKACEEEGVLPSLLPPHRRTLVLLALNLGVCAHEVGQCPARRPAAAHCEGGGGEGHSGHCRGRWGSSGGWGLTWPGVAVHRVLAAPEAILAAEERRGAGARPHPLPEATGGGAGGPPSPRAPQHRQGPGGCCCRRYCCCGCCRCCCCGCFSTCCRGCCSGC